MECITYQIIHNTLFDKKSKNVDKFFKGTRSVSSICDNSKCGRIETTKEITKMNKDNAIKNEIVKKGLKPSSCEEKDSSKPDTVTEEPRRSLRLKLKKPVNLQPTDRHKKDKIIKTASTIKKIVKTNNKKTNNNDQYNVEKKRKIVATKKPTLKYLKQREKDLEVSFNDNDDVFSSSSSYNLNNKMFDNLLPGNLSKTTINTPKLCEKDYCEPITPRTNLLQTWGSTAITPSIAHTKETRKKNKKKGSLEVLYHHLKNKPKKNILKKYENHLYKEKQDNFKETMSKLEILSQPHQTEEAHLDSSVDDYFNNSG